MTATSGVALSQFFGNDCRTAVCGESGAAASRAFPAPLSASGSPAAELLRHPLHACHDPPGRTAASPESFHPHHYLRKARRYWR